MSTSRVPVIPVIAFIAIACGLAWLVALPLWLGEGLASPLTILLLPLMMFTPLVVTIIVVFAFRSPVTDRARFLGLWPLRPARRTVGLIVLAIFGPMVLVLASIAIAAAFGLVQLDLVTFGGFADTLAAAGASEIPLPLGLLVALQFATVPLGAIVNGFFAFGEELGWRGWLVPALRPLGTWPALLISGVIWGLWHSPVILLGYNFGRTDATGVALMVGGCVAWGILFGWLRLRSGSVWPAVFAHGSLNAMGGMVLVLTASGHVPNLALAGPLGVAAWIVIAVVVVVLLATGQFRRQPELAPRPAPLAAAPATPAA